MFTQCKQIWSSLNSLYNTEGMTKFLKLSADVNADAIPPPKSSTEESSQGQPVKRNKTLRVFLLLSKFAFPRVVLTGELMPAPFHWKSWTTLVKAQDMHLAPAGGLASATASPSGCPRTLCICWANDSFNFFDKCFSNSSKTANENSLRSWRSTWDEKDLELKNFYPHRKFDRFPLPWSLK